MTAQPGLIPHATLRTTQGHLERAQETVALALHILQRMYDPNTFRFCHALTRNSTEGARPSFRYTAITLIGLDQAKRYGLTVPFPLDEICSDLARSAQYENDLGNKGLALWAALRLKSPLGDLALDAVLAHRGLTASPVEELIRSTELAWTVYGLVMAWADLSKEKGILNRGHERAAQRRLEEALKVLTSLQDKRSGLFCCAVSVRSQAGLPDQLKTTSGFFDAQVYGAMALARAAVELKRPGLLENAHQTIQAVLKLQGAHGEWPWQYDVRSGTVTDRYPIFAVHQDGLGPMMLLEVGEALGCDFQEPVERSLAWIYGANELGLSLVDRKAGIIWRAVRRMGPLQFVRQIARLAHHYNVPQIARLFRALPGLAITYECRPYHLGWVLYAFCRPSQLKLGSSSLDSLTESREH